MIPDLSSTISYHSHPTHGENTVVLFSAFPSHAGGAEYNAIIRPCPNGSFSDQLEATVRQLASLRESLPGNPIPVFARFFLSDPSNQAEAMKRIDLGCAVSVIGQAPLSADGLPKVALWISLRAEAEIQTLPDGYHSVKLPDGSTELWLASVCRPGLSSHDATTSMLDNLADKLASQGSSLADGCLRTWFFVRDIDVNYAGVVSGRNDVFARHGLSPSTHFIASTGIEGNNPDTSATVTMDSYSVPDLPSGAVRFLYGSSHLNRTSEYGVAFERGVAINFSDRTRVLISGTASIDNKGQIVHPGDICGQTDRMCENVEVLLAEAGCTPADMSHAIVYIRDIADAVTVENIVGKRYPGLPLLLVLAPVCRPGWLVEMECQAIRAL